LFDLNNDLSESNDISEKMPNKVVELDKKLVRWLEETKAKVPKLNPSYISKQRD
jgi:hypothetical protein